MTEPLVKLHIWICILQS